MGCAQSKIENEEAVSRCKDRKNLIKEAVTARYKFASGQSGYAAALRNTGLALSDYGQGESENHNLHHDPTGALPVPPLMESKLPPPPPPPPPPNFSPATPLQRAVSMPEFPVSKPIRKLKNFSIAEDEEEGANHDDEDDDDDGGGGGSLRRRNRRGEETPLPPPSPPLPPPSPPRTPVTATSPPRTPAEATSSPPHSKGGAWDYFFMVDNMPGPSLDDADENAGEVFDERFSRTSNVDGGLSDVGGKMSNVGGGLSEFGGKTSNVGGGLSEFGAKKSNVGGGLSEFGAKTSNVGGGLSEFGAKTNVGGGLSEFSMKTGEFGINTGDVEPKTPEKVVMEGMDTEEEETPVVKPKEFTHSNTAPSDVRRGSSVRVGSSINLLKILIDIDEHFIKASESAQEVSRMLEVTRLHYHSNFADSGGHIDHAARVMRVITWNKLSEDMPSGDGGKGDIYAEDYETHAVVLDKLLAWEKKLFEEVKTGEIMKLEYQRKLALLNKMKKRGTNSVSLEKTKAAVSHLYTKYLVDMQSLDSTVSEVNDIRDLQLYPKLVGLVDGMAKMWKSMSIHHDSQLKIVTELKSIDVSGTPKETSKQHHQRTVELWSVIQDWHSQFDKLVTHQKHYIQCLNSWLKLNLVPVESEKTSSSSSTPPRVQNHRPPIQLLLHSWHDHLEKLPDELARSAIASFAAVINTIVLHQVEEMKMKERCEELRKEYLRKNQGFEEWYQKYMQRRTPPDEMDNNGKDPALERRVVVESLKKRLEEEVEGYQKHCIQVRDKSLGSLKIRLPELFRAMSDYARASLGAYESLRFITQSQNANANAASS